MSQAQGAASAGVMPGEARFRGLARKLCGALALAGMALALAGCGNCGGWSYPGYKAGVPHSCHSEPGSTGGTLLLPSE
jgi:hypothetical protein